MVIWGEPFVIQNVGEGNMKLIVCLFFPPKEVGVWGRRKNFSVLRGKVM
jgi:hypothetical protein